MTPSERLHVLWQGTTARPAPTFICSRCGLDTYGVAPADGICGDCRDRRTEELKGRAS